MHQSYELAQRVLLVSVLLDCGRRTRLVFGTLTFRPLIRRRLPIRYSLGLNRTNLFGRFPTWLGVRTLDAIAPVQLLHEALHAARINVGHCIGC